MKHKIGWHLGNTVPMSSISWAILEAVPPAAVLFITGEHVGPDQLRRILDISPECHFFFRPYFLPSDKAADYQSYLDAVKSLITQHTWDFIPEPQRHLQIFNEPNMPRWSQWEGFGDSEDDMRRFNDWFCKGYNQLKAANPAWKIGFTPLTPGNRDVFFLSDPPNVPYYMHGPEAAKENATTDEIAAAIESGPCREALGLADEYLAHIYVVNNAADQIHQLWAGLRFVQYAKFFPKPMDIWINENGIGGDPQNWVRWFQLLDGYETVKGTCIWRLEHEIRDASGGMVQALRQYVQSPEVKPSEHPPEYTLPVFDPQQRVRNAAWQARSVPHNPEAAFSAYARCHNLGAPLTTENDIFCNTSQGVKVYRFQGFAGGIVYAEVDNWSGTRHMAW